MKKIFHCPFPKTYILAVGLLTRCLSRPRFSTFSTDFGSYKMSKYAIAFITPSKRMQLCHKIVESDTKDSALRRFFGENVSEFYSDNEQGFLYFKEDFYDEAGPAGSIIELS
jgi:hypothetical protein